MPRFEHILQRQHGPGLGNFKLRRVGPRQIRRQQRRNRRHPKNALALTSFFMQRPLDSQNGDSLAVLYDRLTGEVTQGSTVARSVADGFRVFEQNLQGQSLATSGVSFG